MAHMTGEMQTDKRGGFNDDIVLVRQTAFDPDAQPDRNHRLSSPPPAYADLHDTQQYPDRAPDSQPQTADMAYYEDGWSRPWYSRKRIWAVVALVLVVIIIIVVPVAVTVTKQKAENRYPDYSKLNYTLADTYAGETFFDKFNYYTGYDPAHGHVHYVPSEMATQYNLTYTTPQTAVLKVDTTVGPESNPDASTGRFSVRIESKTQYSTGTLFLFSVLHTPYGCGTWPALWLSDPDPNVWPANGEIDVFESTNLGNAGNVASLHTSSGCDMSSVKRQMTGIAGQGDCYNATNDNTGCGVSGSVQTYGEKFNADGGGVMAVELRDEGIRVWQFGRDSLPADIKANSTAPDPSSWTTAFADFPNTKCDIGGHFRNQSIIANIDLCGDLTEAVWKDSGCPGKCVNFVSDNPKEFVDAYWEFDSFKVFKAS